MKPEKWEPLSSRICQGWGETTCKWGFTRKCCSLKRVCVLIAVNDNVDSANGGMDNDFTPLRNLFNEWLVRDTSKKIKAVKKVKRHERQAVTSKPVYGYVMDEDEKLHHRRGSRPGGTADLPALPCRETARPRLPVC